MNLVIMTFVLWAVIEISFDKLNFGVMMLLFLNHSSGSVMRENFLIEFQFSEAYEAKCVHIRIIFQAMSPPLYRHLTAIDRGRPAELWGQPSESC